MEKKIKKLLTVSFSICFIFLICSVNHCHAAMWYTNQEIIIAEAEVYEVLSMQFKKPKNVIYMIGDGMGPNDIILAEKYNPDCYDFGLVLNKIPNTGWATTYSNNSGVTDSAASGTALATGYKTNNGYVGMLPNGEILKNISEIARENGKKIGIVTNDKAIGATPSAFGIHNVSRDNYTEIAKSFIDLKADVLIGTGVSYFSGLEKDAFIVADGINNFNSVLDTDANCKKPFLGFLSSDAVTDKNTLGYCTEVAINRLSKNSPNGFFLMIENTACDNAGHSNNIDGKLKGVVTFDRAIATVLKFMKNNPDTLLIITSDHETGGVKLPADNKHPDNALFTTINHTGINVRTFAVGYGAEYFNSIVVDNTDIARFAINAVKNETSGTLGDSTNSDDNESRGRPSDSTNYDNELQINPSNSISSNKENESQSDFVNSNISSTDDNDYSDNITSEDKIDTNVTSKKDKSGNIIIPIILISFAIIWVGVVVFFFIYLSICIKKKKKQPP